MRPSAHESLESSRLPRGDVQGQADDHVGDGVYRQISPQVAAVQTARMISATVARCDAIPHQRIGYRVRCDSRPR